MTESLFNKVAGLRPATLLTKRLWHKCFFCEFCEIFKDTLFLSLSYTYAFINNEIKPGNKLSSVDQNICESKRLEACNVIKKETPTSVFSCEFCEIFKNTFFIEHLWVTASGFWQNLV